MPLQRPLMPGFLKKADHYLLVHYPAIWSTRVHLVLYYALLFMLVLSVVYYSIPDNILENSTMFSWMGFVSLISIIGLVVWLIYLLRFNVFKKYGPLKASDTVVCLLLWLLAAASINAFIYIPSLIETARANKAISTDELNTDINHINTYICQLYYPQLDHQWQKDSVKLASANELKSKEAQSADVADADTVVIRRLPQYRLLDSAALQNRLAQADSVYKLRDSIYYTYECPDFSFVSNIYTDMRDYRSSLLLDKKGIEIGVKQMRSIDIYHAVLEHYTAPDTAAIAAALAPLLQKYYSQKNTLIYALDEPDDKIEAKIRKRYQLNSINDGIRNISERKYRWQLYGGIMWRFFFYSSFLFTILLFIYRHTSLRAFFLSLLTLVLLSIFTGLLLAIGHNSDTAGMLEYIFYSVLFLVLGSLVFVQQKRNMITGIAINLWVMSVPFLPMLIASYYYTQKLSALMQEHSRTVEYLRISTEKEWVLQWAEIAGPVLFVLLAGLYMHRLYRRWYALPPQ